MNPALPTYVPSANWATTYDLPPTVNADGARRAGAVPVLVMVTGSLDPFTLLTISCTGPVALSSGIWTLTWPELVKSTNAGLPFTVTLTPLSFVGALLPEKSLPPQVPVTVAMFEP